jgi:hypothetical protein
VNQFHTRRSSAASLFLALAFALISTASAYAHVGNKDIYQTITAGPYKLFVVVRTPLVIPGVATVEVRSIGAPGGAAGGAPAGGPIHSISITPLPLTGEASKHPPTSDAMKPSDADPNFFTGSLWIMAPGSWQVRFSIDGTSGSQTAGVPVPAVPIATLQMQRPLGILLGILGLTLVLGFAGIVAAAAREARLAAGIDPTPSRRRRGLIAGFAAFAVAIGTVYLGGKWWNVEAADYAAGMFHNSQLRPTLSGDQLVLQIVAPDPTDGNSFHLISNSELLTDHGHLMHLYAIRWPQMDAVFHLHPAPTGKRDFVEVLPSMPPGVYRLYADVVFLNGFPDTATATLTIPSSMSSAPVSGDDAGATPPALSTTQLGPVYKLPDGYTMTWDRPSTLAANTGYNLTFHLLDPHGKSALDMQPYLGMPGHAAFVKTDGSAFAHTHPDGSAAMPAVMLAEESSGLSMPDMSGMSSMDMSAMPSEPVSSTVAFPYGFPSPGRYRIFIQMKHGSTTETGVVETGVFDAVVE